MRAIFSGTDERGRKTYLILDEKGRAVGTYWEEPVMEALS